MLSIALFHWFSSGSNCKIDIMWPKLFLPSMLYAQLISFEIIKYPDLKLQSSMSVSGLDEIFFFWLWKSKSRVFSMKTISLSTILYSVCSNPVTKNHFHELFMWYAMFYRIHYKTLWSKDLCVFYLVYFPLLQKVVSCLRLMRINPFHLFRLLKWMMLTHVWILDSTPRLFQTYNLS